MDGPLKTILPMGSHMHRTFYRIYWRNWRKYLPGKDLLPKSTLAQAVGYALNEYNAICDIFKRGDTALDNNYIERIQRYISLSRRNSMFFGSHEGARRGSYPIFYSYFMQVEWHQSV